MDDFAVDVEGASGAFRFLAFFLPRLIPLKRFLHSDAVRPGSWIGEDVSLTMPCVFLPYDTWLNTYGLGAGCPLVTLIILEGKDVGVLVVTPWLFDPVGPKCFPPCAQNQVWMRLSSSRCSLWACFTTHLILKWFFEAQGMLFSSSFHGFRDRCPCSAMKSVRSLSSFPSPDEQIYRPNLKVKGGLTSLDQS